MEIPAYMRLSLWCGIDCGGGRRKKICAIALAGSVGTVVSIGGNQLSLIRRMRRGAAAILRNVLYETGGLRRIAQERNGAAILMFHEIEPETSAEFHDLLRRLSKDFEIVPLAALLNKTAQAGSRRSMRVALTFDDGLRNQYTVAYPILSDLKIPATFYVCPGLIGQQTTTWTWEMWCRIPWLGVSDRQELFGGEQDFTDIESLLEQMKSVPISKRSALEAEIRARTPGFKFAEAERIRYELMDWNELAQLDPALINIGSHSLTHPDLPQLGPEQLEGELTMSRAQLENYLGRPVLDFAYPNGNHSDAVEHATALRYRSAVTTICGRVGPEDSPFRLKRIGATLDLKWTTWLLATHTGRAHQC